MGGKSLLAFRRFLSHLKTHRQVFQAYYQLHLLKDSSSSAMCVNLYRSSELIADSDLELVDWIRPGDYVALMTTETQLTCLPAGIDFWDRYLDGEAI